MSTPITPEQAKANISSGVYDDDTVFDIALDRMIDAMEAPQLPADFVDEGHDGILA